MKTLIVEDSKLISERLRLALAPLPGMEIAVADHLAEGLRYFRLFHPQCVILDLDLPDGSGIALLTKIKLEAPGTVVAIFSNHLGFRRRCTSAGADFFFDKSVDFEQLTQAVRGLVEDRS